MGIRLHLRGDRRALSRAGLLVMNHMSWLDPLILARLTPLYFITSRETEGMRLLGDIARRGGCLFTERRSLRATHADSRHLATDLQRKPVVVFPEATSSDGSRVLPFKPAFFQSALDAGCPIRPLVLRYTKVGSAPFTKANHHRVCWYGDMTFLPHLTRVLATRSIEVELRILPPLDLHTADRKQAALVAHAAVDAGYGRPW